MGVWPELLKNNFGGKVIKIQTWTGPKDGFSGKGWVLTGGVYWELENYEFDLTFSYCKPSHTYSKKLFTCSSNHIWATFAIKNPTLDIINDAMGAIIKMIQDWKNSRAVFEKTHDVQMFQRGQFFEYEGSDEN